MFDVFDYVERFQKLVRDGKPVPFGVLDLIVRSRPELLAGIGQLAVCDLPIAKPITLGQPGR